MFLIVFGILNGAKPIYKRVMGLQRDNFEYRSKNVKSNESYFILAWLGKPTAMLF